MGFAAVDGYLLGDPVSKAEAVDELLASRSDAPAAAPFYRALEAVGVRAADEAFIALRLVLAGRVPQDDAVRRIRAVAGLARACAANDTRTIDAIRKRDAPVLGDLAGVSGPSLGAAARSVYFAELVADTEKRNGSDPLRR
jgi:hypothetical protein